MYLVCVSPLFNISVVSFQLFNWFRYRSVAPCLPSVSASLIWLYSTIQRAVFFQQESASKTDSFPHAVLPMLVSVRSQSRCSLVSNVHFQYSSHIIHLMLPGPEQMRSLQSISFQLKWITKWFECSFNNCFGRRPWKRRLCGGKKTLLQVRISLMFS